jgi:hypothetical protein
MGQVFITRSCLREMRSLLRRASRKGDRLPVNAIVFCAFGLIAVQETGPEHMLLDNVADCCEQARHVTPTHPAATLGIENGL